MARGDHIYTRRFGGVYAHHGIDAGDGTVIHYTSDHWAAPREVRRTTLEEFTKGDQLLVRDYHKFIETVEKGDVLDKASQNFNRVMDGFRGLSAESMDFSEYAVMQRAESRVGEYAFDLMFNNCEHFATWCKTGISNSEQITDLWRYALTGGGFLKYQARETLTNIAELPWRV